MRISEHLRPTFHSAGWLLAAAVLTIVLQAAIVARAVAINVDGLMFVDLAKKYESDPLKTMRVNDQHPGYPAMVLAADKTLALLGWAPGPEQWTVATRMASGVCGLLSVFAMWLFARRMFDQQVANIAALSIAVLPIFRMNASDALSDTPHLLFYLFAAWCAAEAFASSRAAWWAACGAVGGLAFWVRPEGLEAPLVGGLLLVAVLARRRAPARQTLRSLAALAAGTAVVAGPYMLLAGKITSKQVPFFKRDAAPVFVVTESQAALRLAAKGSPPDGETVVETPIADDAEFPTAPVESWDETAISPIGALAAAPAASDQDEEQLNAVDEAAGASARKNPAPAQAAADSVSVAAPAKPALGSPISLPVVLRLARRATVCFVKNIVWGFRFAFLPLYLLGNYEMFRRKVPNWTIALPLGMGLLHISVLYYVFFMSGYMDQRHIMVLVALAVPFAVLGMLYLSERLQTALSPRLPLGLALPLVVLLSCGTVLPRSLAAMNMDLAPVFHGAAWVHDHARPGDAVVSNTPFVAFYGDLPAARLEPNTASIETAIVAGPTGVRYEFAVLDLQIEGYRPQWRDQIERDFQEVMRLEYPRRHGDSLKLLVYRRRAGDSAARGASDGWPPRLGAAPGGARQ